ncbi:MAG TPA: hypothetical protein PLL09_12305 [Flavobacterium sp.]|uniref:hypothetical protein n=1 Tax=unclassified Flavobacterium TaxID=196869 RepID=UPI000E9EFC70|nr:MULTISPECIES: hypothetical protein [unclassified Flavobacterium]HBI02181.1 hypothetical protein [Flavobacterium sp.]HRE78593.1 hypothetical protein [Flavobacterium sp.]
MEPNNIDKQIKEKLNQREIQPSANAWDRLDAMLSVEEQKPKRSYKWLSIAAVFVGFTLIGIFMMNKENSTENVILSNPIVLENETKLIENESTPKIENNLSEAKEVEAVVHQLTKKIEKPSTEINPKKDFLLDNHSKNEELIVESQPKESTAKYINAESLLAEIETGEKIEIPNISKKPSVKVDANALLSSAEKEVDETFRDKVIQSINKKYNSVKSTLANRNYE